MFLKNICSKSSFILLPNVWNSHSEGSQDEKFVSEYDIIAVDPSTPWYKLKHIHEGMNTA